MNYLYYIILVFIISEIVVLKMHDFYIYPINIILFDFICCVIGNYYLFDISAYQKYLIAYILFFIGYCVAYFLKKDKSREIKIEKDKKYDKDIIYRTILIFTIIVTIASYYHIIKVGIPLFSSNIEISRFDFTGSGFFGIPGRIYLFGYTFLIPYIYYYYNSDHDDRLKVLLRFVWILYIILSVLGGFKSSISALILYYINIKALTGNPIRIKSFFTPKFIMAFVGAVIFAIGISKVYKSVNVSSTNDAINYLFTRLFSFGSLGGNMLLNKVVAIPSDKILINDSIYFLHKYFHIDLVNYNITTMSKYVAAYNLKITNISDDVFISPYSLGAFPELYFDFGYLSYLFISLVGAIYSYLSFKKAGKFYRQACISFFIIFVLNSYIPKGSLIYCLVNFIMMIIFFKVVETVIRTFVLITSKN